MVVVQLFFSIARELGSDMTIRIIFLLICVGELLMQVKLSVLEHVYIVM